MAHPCGKRVGTVLIGMLFISALLPRLCAIDRYITPNEAANNSLTLPAAIFVRRSNE